MADATKYFRFSGGKKVDSTLPSWAQDTELYTGQFAPPSGKKAISDRRKLQAASQGLVNGKSGKVTPGFAKACLRAKMIHNGCEKDALGSNREYLLAEYTDNSSYEGSSVGPGVPVVVAINRAKGAVFARSGSKIYETAKNTTAPIFLAMFTLFLQDTEFNTTFTEFVSETDENELKRELCLLADIAYYICKDEDTEAYNIQEPQSIRDFTPTKQNAVGKPFSFFGHYTILQVSGVSAGGLSSSNGRAMPTKDFVGKYKFYSDSLTPEQEELVPVLDDTYIVGKNDVLICKCLHATTGMSRPIRDILLRGAPGAGKSYMGQGIAAGTHLPLYFFSAHAMTEPYDIFGQYVPADGNGKAIPITKIVQGLPSAEDMALDPEASYINITGEAKPGATATDCLQAAFKKAEASLKKNGLNQQFVFAPGQLVRALEGGGVWVFDEVSLINNPGVAPALNPLMDGTQAVTLPNGKVVHRHPNCVFLSTMNVEQEGCRRVNQAWQDRHPIIIDLEDPDDSELLARVKAMTDYDDTKNGNIDLTVFLDAYHKIGAYLRKHHIDDGTAGPRKLADWVQTTMVLDSAREAASITIIPGATSDRQAQGDLMDMICDMFAD